MRRRNLLPRRATQHLKHIIPTREQHDHQHADHRMHREVHSPRRGARPGKDSQPPFLQRHARYRHDQAHEPGNQHQQLDQHVHRDTGTPPGREAAPSPALPAAAPVSTTTANTTASFASSSSYAFAPAPARLLFPSSSFSCVVRGSAQEQLLLVDPLAAVRVPEVQRVVTTIATITIIIFIVIIATALVVEPLKVSHEGPVLLVLVGMVLDELGHADGDGVVLLVRGRGLVLILVLMRRRRYG
ncbi:hypothetical protein VTK26DRAFT_2450 [Humicola hyalothermophila]